MKSIDPVQASERIITLRIDIAGAKPKIWRRVEVPSDFTLGDLHYVIQIAMGWENSHLHAFRVGHEVYALSSDESDFDSIVEDADSVSLDTLGLYRKGKKFYYEYDFGDSWEHELLVEAATPRKRELIYPRCLKAVGACPLEDSGGIYRYQELSRILKDPGHSEYEDVVDWVGPDFDPKLVDIEEINKALADGFSS